MRRKIERMDDDASRRSPNIERQSRKKLTDVQCSGSSVCFEETCLGWAWDQCPRRKDELTVPPGKKKWQVPGRPSSRRRSKLSRLFSGTAVERPGQGNDWINEILNRTRSFETRISGPSQTHWCTSFDQVTNGDKHVWKLLIRFRFVHVCPVVRQATQVPLSGGAVSRGFSHQEVLSWRTKELDGHHCGYLLRPRWLSQQSRPEALKLQQFIVRKAKVPIWLLDLTEEANDCWVLSVGIVA